MNQIPKAVIAVVSEALAYFYTNTKLNNLFFENGAKGEPPAGNKIDKCHIWLNQCSDDSAINSFEFLGNMLEVFMDIELDPNQIHTESHQANREKIKKILGKYNLQYQTGGIILGATRGTPSRTLSEILNSRDLGGLEQEFHRAINSIESDPAAGLTASVLS